MSNMVREIICTDIRDVVHFSLLVDDSLTSVSVPHSRILLLEVANLSTTSDKSICEEISQLTALSGQYSKVGAVRQKQPVIVIAPELLHSLI